MKNVIIISGSLRVGGNTPMPWPADQKGPEIVERILKLLESGPLRSSAIRKAVGICSGIHLSNQPGISRGLAAPPDGQPVDSLFDLAPRRVCPARVVSAAPVVSYTALSP